MAKVKFDDLDELDSATSKAALQATSEKKTKKLKDMLVRGVPVEIYDALKENGLT